MPKYYCDYCDKFLTHDSPSVLFVSTTRSGWRSRYKSWLIMPLKHTSRVPATDERASVRHETTTYATAGSSSRDTDTAWCSNATYLDTRGWKHAVCASGWHTNTTGESASTWDASDDACSRGSANRYQSIPHWSEAMSPYSPISTRRTGLNAATAKASTRRILPPMSPLTLLQTSALPDVRGHGKAGRSSPRQELRRPHIHPPTPP
nr:unnamed protein product [Spirometra erinaceieuropaei]